MINVCYQFPHLIISLISCRYYLGTCSRLRIVGTWYWTGRHVNIVPLPQLVLIISTHPKSNSVGQLLRKKSLSDRPLRSYSVLGPLFGATTYCSPSLRCPGAAFCLNYPSSSKPHVVFQDVLTASPGSYKGYMGISFHMAICHTNIVPTSTHERHLRTLPIVPSGFQDWPYRSPPRSAPKILPNTDRPFLHPQT